MNKILVATIISIVIIVSITAGIFLLYSPQITLKKETVTIVDGAGRTVTIPKSVNRVVSLVTGISGIIYEIGAGDKLVGVTQSLPFPHYYYYPETKKLADVGSIANPNVEKIVELKPDAVFTTEFFLEASKPIEERGIPVVAIRLNTVEDIIWNVKFLGFVLGKEDEAKKLSQEMEKTIILIKSRTQKWMKENNITTEELPKVYVESSRGKTYGANSWCTEEISIAGGVNIYGTSVLKMPIPNTEYIVSQNPDAIILFVVAKDYDDFLKKAKDYIESVKNRPGWENIKAVKENRFLVIDNHYTNFGPDQMKGIVAVAKFLHPYLFKDLEWPKWAYTTMK